MTAHKNARFSDGNRCDAGASFSGGGNPIRKGSESEHEDRVCSSINVNSSNDIVTNDSSNCYNDIDNDTSKSIRAAADKRRSRRLAGVSKICIT